MPDAYGQRRQARRSGIALSGDTVFARIFDAIAFFPPTVGALRFANPTGPKPPQVRWRN